MLPSWPFSVLEPWLLLQILFRNHHCPEPNQPPESVDHPHSTAIDCGLLLLLFLLYFGIYLLSVLVPIGWRDVWFWRKINNIPLSTLPLPLNRYSLYIYFPVFDLFESNGHTVKSWRRRRRKSIGRDTDRSAYNLWAVKGKVLYEDMNLVGWNYKSNLTLSAAIKCLDRTGSFQLPELIK